MLVTLSYASRAVEVLDEAAVGALQAVAQAANRRNGISGLLLRADRTYLQVLEGDEAAVRATMQRISADPRHTDLFVLDWRAIARRRYSRWDLAVVNAERHVGFPGLDAMLLPGFGPAQAHARTADTLDLLHRLPALIA